MRYDQEVFNVPNVNRRMLSLVVMPSDVFLIGSAHKFQTKACCYSWEIADFCELIRRSVAAHGIRLIAEEMSIEGLQIDGARESTCKEVADSCGVKHVYCDPDRKERELLGILNDEDREREWLTRLRKRNIRPALLICGAQHVDSFAKLMRQHGVLVTVLFGEWPNR